MKAIWTGAIGFGLVNIPVKMFSASQASELDLDMLDKKDHSNIRFLRVNEKTGKPVDWANIVKGYKYNDKYVILNSHDFELASAKKSAIVSIASFVDEQEIDSLYYETPYYLEPDKAGAHAYALLREALAKTGKVAIATFVMRHKQILAVLRPADKVIILNRIRFAEEIRDPGELSLPDKQDIKPAELTMAISLIKQLSSRFSINKYKDTYTAELLKLIKAKVKGLRIREPSMKIVHSKSQDLMEQLKASLHIKQRKAS